MKINKAGQERGAPEARGNSAREADTSMEARRKGARPRSGRSSDFARITGTYADESD